MSTTTIQQNIIYGLSEGGSVADTTMLAYALRWANASYREIFARYRFKHLRTRSIFRTADGQQSYQAPSDFIGFITLKDESNEQILTQVTPEEFSRSVSVTTITNETFESDDGVAVDLDNGAIVQYSETVQDDTTIYTRDTDYTIDYSAGTITVDVAEGMSDATDYYVDYTYYAKDPPIIFCLEYDATNTKYVFRLSPTPDGIYIASLVYPALPSDLSGSTNAIWSQLEFCLERGGIYYGSLEIVEDAKRRVEFKTNYEKALEALVLLDLDLVPKHDRIRVVMKKSDN